MKPLQRLLGTLVLSLLLCVRIVAAPPPEMTAQDLGAFFDGLVPMQLERNDVAGAVVAVVKDGRILFSKGYGSADIEARRPVSADETLFRVGSVSKLFTWTSVMQLVEQGRLSLDADVNGYLDFHLPDAFGKPVTLRNLMTHTAGFEDSIQGLFAADPEHIPDLRAAVMAHPPARIFAPGTVSAYSNYGALLAAYIVQRVSGEAYGDYVQRHILVPLGMTHTTLAQPVPAPLLAGLSKGYDTTRDKPHAFEAIGIAPAGAISSTASDMARFMIAHLQKGELGGSRVLKPETAALMQARAFGFDPRINGMCLGFYEESCGGLRIIGHGGDTLYFHSDLHLIPEAAVGFFVSYNSAGNHGAGGRAYLFRRFLERYFAKEAFPSMGTELKAVDGAGDDAKKVTGWYMVSRRGQTNLTHMDPIGDQEQVTVAKGGDLEVDSIKGLDGKPLRFRETSRGLWEDTAGTGRRLVFREGEDGILRYATGPIMQSERVGLKTNSVLINGLVYGSFLVGALTLVLWPVAALARRHFGAGAPGQDEIAARRRTRVLSVLVLSPWLLAVAALIRASDYEGITSPGFEMLLRAGITAAWACALAVVPAAWLAFKAWRTPGLWWWARVHRSLVLLAFLGTAYVCYMGSVLRLNLAY